MRALLLHHLNMWPWVDPTPSLGVSCSHVFNNISKHIYGTLPCACIVLSIYIYIEYYKVGTIFTISHFTDVKLKHRDVKQLAQSHMA